ncbi:MAG: ABC transporter permease subunit [Tissierellia bacterium]|nr:ABC transporter permease subunit [Tissierellia bacterium]
MNIFKEEFRKLWKSAFLWGLAIGGFGLFYLAFYPSLAKNQEGFMAIIDAMPKEILEALGMRYGLPLASIMGYFTLTFSMMQMAMGIQSAYYGVAILSEEEREQTADFLLTKPVTRGRIFRNKLFATICALGISGLLQGALILFAVSRFHHGEDFDYSLILKVLGSIPFLQGVFLGMGMLLSMGFRKVRNITSLSVGFVTVFYILNGIIAYLPIDQLRYFTPFHYFEAGYIVTENSYNMPFLLLAVGLILSTMVLSYLQYLRRDMEGV